MGNSLDRDMQLRLELFVDDLPASIDFYGRVLGFTMGEQQSDGYTPMTSGNAYLALNVRAALPPDHPVQATAAERLGRGVEIVLEVDDLQTAYEHVRSQRWPLSGDLQPQPWGAADFRVLDPNGYYVRITSRN